MEDKYKSIFDGMSDEEFEELLKSQGFKYTKVEKGKGGIVFSASNEKEFGI